MEKLFLLTQGACLQVVFVTESEQMSAERTDILEDVSVADWNLGQGLKKGIE